MRAFAQKPTATREIASTKASLPGRTRFGQSREVKSIFELQRTIGNQAVQWMLQTDAEEIKAGSASTASPQVGHDAGRIPLHSAASETIQAKSAINKPGDRYEQEADRVSEQVMRLPEPRLQRACACGGQCSACQTEQHGHGHERLHMQGVEPGDRKQTEVPPIVHDVLRTPGQPIDLATRAFMEPRFGEDFSPVRVHTNELAARSAQAIGAHAYTVGNNIIFGHGRFDSNGTEGRRLIAHELTHVVQQSAEPTAGVAAREPAAGFVQRKEDPKASAKTTVCDTGCAQRWGQETTCSKWGFKVGESEHAPHYVFRGGKGTTVKDLLTRCCNSWPWSLEDYARRELGLNGAASCPWQHQREIATITSAGKDVQVLCSDTIDPKDVGQRPNAKDCMQKPKPEVIEMSPKAMQDLSGQVANQLPVSVCYSGSKQDLCLHNGPGKASRPEIKHCLTEGCTPQEGTPALKDTAWPPV